MQQHPQPRRYRVGVVGGGQLARMMAEPAAALGIELVALVEALDGSAAQVIPNSRVGDARDPQALVELAGQCDVVTFEHEHVDNAALHALIEQGHSVQPGPHALQYAQNKLLMRHRLEQLGLPNPRWCGVTDPAELTAFGEEVGWPVIVKTPTGGYDGKGVAVVHSADEVTWWSAGELLVEEKVDFATEIAVLVARNPSGEVRTWAPVETIQRGGVCSEVISPAQLVDHSEAAKIAVTIATGLDVTGVLAVEMFQRTNGSLLVNELAMRPHNSGHVTIEGHHTSQFEQHLRAVLDLPLGPTTQRDPHVVMVNVLGSAHEDPTALYPELFTQFPQARAHWYGKGVRPGRKLGHVTVHGSDLEQILQQGRSAARLLEG